MITYEEARNSEVMRYIRICKKLNNTYEIVDVSFPSMLLQGDLSTIEEAKNTYIQMYIECAPSIPID